MRKLLIKRNPQYFPYACRVFSWERYGLMGIRNTSPMHAEFSHGKGTGASAIGIDTQIGTQIGTQADTDTLTRPVEQDEDGDHDRFAHYIKKEKIVESAVTGKAVRALCGKKWVPSRDPQKFPICPICKEIYEGLKES